MQPFDMVHVGMAAAALDTIEDVRKSEKNRLLALLRPIEKGGYGLPTDAAAVIQQAAFVASLNCGALSDTQPKEGDDKKEAIPSVLAEQFKVAKVRGKSCCIEHTLIKNLEKAVKQCPLGPWILEQKGIGLKQAGRLLGAIGDPYWHSGYFNTGAVDKAGEPVMKAYDRPRTVSELWSYCGYAVINGEAPRHRKGVQGRWNDTARMRAWNIAGSCKMQKGVEGARYREVYDTARDKYADGVHAKDCIRCGPSGKPAPMGSPLSLAHQDARGLRMVAKEFLKDMWSESKRLHELGDEAILPSITTT